jgi:selenocysteine lyase/cysteine desulfurase
MITAQATAADMLADVRAREFARLDHSGLAYLDYTGAALYPESIVLRHAEKLLRHVYGNPHSESVPSRSSTAQLDRIRARVRGFFRASDEYDVVFTPNATGAIHHIAAGFPFNAGSRLVLTSDNHNSVNGIREYARRAGAVVEYIPLDAELRAPSPEPWLQPVAAPALFAYPAQSNFSGVRHPLHWIEIAQARNYHVLLDAAAFVPSVPLDLSAVTPDYVSISCYKMFGYPTSSGILLARRAALATLQRPWFAGGTVDYASVQNRLHRLRADAERFQDGTPDFLGVTALADGFDFLASIGMANIAAHLNALTAALLAGIADINRALGFERVIVYGPRDLTCRGGTVAFNVAERDGTLLRFEDVERAAVTRGIALRAGCFCNPGAAEFAFDIPAERAWNCLQQVEFSKAALRDCLEDRAVGALRASMGLANNHSDVDRLLALLRDL